MKGRISENSDIYLQSNKYRQLRYGGGLPGGHKAISGLFQEYFTLGFHIRISVDGDIFQSFVIKKHSKNIAQSEF